MRTIFNCGRCHGQKIKETRVAGCAIKGNARFLLAAKFARSILNGRMELEKESYRCGTAPLMHTEDRLVNDSEV